MNWTEYKKLLDHKITDAQFNYEYAEKKARAAKAHLNAAIREKESFEQALSELTEGKHD